MDGQGDSVSTRNRLLFCIDDIDLIIRQLFDTLAQQQSTQDLETSQPEFKMDASALTDLLIDKNKELSGLAAIAREQQRLHHNIQLLKSDISTQNQVIGCLQRRLKNAEFTLAAALYRAKEGLKKFDAASKESVSCESVIKYAHKISACCSIAAPLDWTAGDPRRPYPQDIQMRSGLLGQINQMPRSTDEDLKIPQQLGTEGLQVPDFKTDSRWSTNPSDLGGMNLLKGHDEVEVMSSESSTSDSSDSSFGND
ncbi:mediator of RNA polymerase II transcription subunit 4-like [Clavelina lepadiformis]|uniref:mediator of RNA polymerase II transcription subunit 4-like n=1 Tax=Clavelina lepadiformis TaxID=159417 RepID=UPI00404324BF